MSKSHYNYSDAQEQQTKVAQGLKNALNRLGAANGWTGVEDALSHLSVVPKRWEEKECDKLTALFENFKLPHATVTEHQQAYEALCLRREREENERKLAAEAEALRQTTEQIQRGQAGQLFQFPPQPGVHPGGVAGISHGLYPPLLPPHLATAEFVLPRRRDPYRKEATGRVVGFDIIDFTQLERPLQFDDLIDLKFIQDEIIHLPCIQSVDLEISISGIVHKAQYLGFSHDQTRQMFQLFLRQHFPVYYSSLVATTDWKQYYTELISFVNLHDQSVKIDAALQALTREPGEQITAITSRWLGLEKLKYKHKAYWMPRDKRELKAKNAILEKLGIFLSDACAEKYKSWKNQTRRRGDAEIVQNWEKVLSKIVDWEREDEYRLKTTKHMDASTATKVSTFATEVSQYRTSSGSPSTGTPSSWSQHVPRPMHDGRRNRGGTSSRESRSPGRNRYNQAGVHSSRFDSKSRSPGSNWGSRASSRSPTGRGRSGTPRSGRSPSARSSQRSPAPRRSSDPSPRTGGRGGRTGSPGRQREQQSRGEGQDSGRGSRRSQSRSPHRSGQQWQRGERGYPDQRDGGRRDSDRPRSGGRQDQGRRRPDGRRGGDGRRDGSRSPWRSGGRRSNSPRSSRDSGGWSDRSRQSSYRSSRDDRDGWRDSRSDRSRWSGRSGGRDPGRSDSNRSGNRSDFRSTRPGDQNRRSTPSPTPFRSAERKFRELNNKFDDFQQKFNKPVVGDVRQKPKN